MIKEEVDHFSGIGENGEYTERVHMNGGASAESVEACEEAAGAESLSA